MGSGVTLSPKPSLIIELEPVRASIAVAYLQPRTNRPPLRGFGTFGYCARYGVALDFRKRFRQVNFSQSDREREPPSALATYTYENRLGDGSEQPAGKESRFA